MKRRHTLFKINVTFCLEVGVNVDFKRCVAAVRKWLSTKLTAIKSGTANTVTRIASAASLRWAVEGLKLTTIVAIVLVFHQLITTMNRCLGLGLSSLQVELLCSSFVEYYLHKAEIFK